MNSVKHFFRRYIFSTVGIIALFFMINILLLGMLNFILYLDGATNSHPVIEELSNHITLKDGKINADKDVQKILQHEDAWAMLLNDIGDVIWEYDLPSDFSRKYTSADIALFSRWYLKDYPVNVWKHPEGLLVIGFPPGYIVNHYLSFKTIYLRPLFITLGIVFFTNIFLLIYLLIRNTYRIEKAIKPALNGIQALSKSETFHLDEKGELSEINICLNHAGEYLQKKDNTRAEWIRGVSHDIRTPLSIILGYACEIEDDTNLPIITRKQAKAIRKKSEKLQSLISDLNLTTKLEYSMYPLKKRSVDIVELARQVVSEFLNELPEQYHIEFREDSQSCTITLNGDHSLLHRMLYNLISNCIIHNPNGCNITLSIFSNADSCFFDICDDGCGISPARLKTLNDTGTIFSTQEKTECTEHGLGIKIVQQIVNLHKGKLYFSNLEPHGLSVKIEIPFIV